MFRCCFSGGAQLSEVAPSPTSNDDCRLQHASDIVPGEVRHSPPGLSPSRRAPGSVSPRGASGGAAAALNSPLRPLQLNGEDSGGKPGCVTAHMLVERGVHVISAASPPSERLGAIYAVLKLDVGSATRLGSPEVPELSPVSEGTAAGLVQEQRCGSVVGSSLSGSSAQLGSGTPRAETMRTDNTSSHSSCLHQLSPIFISAAARQRFMLGKEPAGYAKVLRKLVQRDPLLSFALQRALKYLKAGETKTVHHIMSDAGVSGPAALYAMRLSACVWQDSFGHQMAALLVEHHLPYNPQDLMPKLMRDYAILSQVPHVLTLIDHQCKVLYQNAASLLYMGDFSSLSSSDCGSSVSTGILELLFCHEPGSLKALLHSVAKGMQWRQRVKVPASVKRLVVRKRRKYLVDLMEPGGGPAAMSHLSPLHVPLPLSAAPRHLSASHTSVPGSGGVVVRRTLSPEKSVDGTQRSTTVSGNGEGSALNSRNNSDAPVKFADEDDLVFCINSFSGPSPGTREVPVGQHPPLPGTGAGGAVLMPSANLPNVPSATTVMPGASQGAAAGLAPTRTLSLARSGRLGEDGHMLSQRRLLYLMDSARSSINRRDSLSSRGGASLVKRESMSMRDLPAPPGGEHPPLLATFSLRDTRPASTRSTVEDVAEGWPGLAAGPHTTFPEHLTCDASAASVLTDVASPAGVPDIETCWHEIQAIPLLDPILDKQVILVVQTDITSTVDLENRLGDLTDAQFVMLDQLFPRHVIEFMLSNTPSQVSRNLSQLANYHPQVVVMFCDVVGFTAMSEKVDAHQVLIFINQLYTAFDGLVDDYGLYKLDTSGDCYIVAAGIIEQDEDGFSCVQNGGRADLAERAVLQAVTMMTFAKQLLRAAHKVVMPHNGQPVQLRIGLHSGPLVSGLVGPKMPKFTAFGSTMNTASRMESTCLPGCIQASAVTAKMLPSERWQSTGGVDVKGIGMMETFLWTPSAADLEDSSDDDVCSVQPLSQIVGSSSSASTTPVHSDGGATSSSATSGRAEVPGPLPEPVKTPVRGPGTRQEAQRMAAAAVRRRSGPLIAAGVGAAGVAPEVANPWSSSGGAAPAGKLGSPAAPAGQPPGASSRVHRSSNLSLAPPSGSGVGQSLMTILANLRTHQTSIDYA